MGIVERYDLTLGRLDSWINKILESTKKDYDADTVLEILKDVRERLVKSPKDIPEYKE